MSKDLKSDVTALSKTFWVILVVVIMVAASSIAALVLLGGEGDATVKTGDKVSVNYIGFVNITGVDKVFDTSFYSVALDNATYPKVPWFDLKANTSYKPLNFTIGSGQVIIGFDQGLLGMKEGETRTVIIPPEQGYGSADQSKIINISLVQTAPLFVECSLTEFKSTFGVDAVGGLFLNHPVNQWPVQVLSVDSAAEKVQYQNMVSINKTYHVYGSSTISEVAGWDIKITDIDPAANDGMGEFTFQHQLDDGDSWTMIGYGLLSGTTAQFVLNEVDTEAGTATLNYNNPLMGQTLVFEVTMEKITPA